jgi:hypothetical protein
VALGTTVSATNQSWLKKEKENKDKNLTGIRMEIRNEIEILSRRRLIDLIDKKNRTKIQI